MGIEVIQCNNLPSTDENGYTDAYVVLQVAWPIPQTWVSLNWQWENMEAKTKIVYKNLNPVFREKLYFPILLFRFSAGAGLAEGLSA